MEMQIAGGATLGDGVLKIQRKPYDFGNATVAVHGDVAQKCTGLVIKTKLLPRGYQRAVVEVNGNIVVVSLNIVHVNGLGANVAFLSKENVLKVHAVFGGGALLFEVVSLYLSGA